MGNGGKRQRIIQITDMIQLVGINIDTTIKFSQSKKKKKREDLGNMIMLDRLELCA